MALGLGPTYERRSDQSDRRRLAIQARLALFEIRQEDGTPDPARISGEKFPKYNEEFPKYNKCSQGITQSPWSTHGRGEKLVVSQSEAHAKVRCSAKKKGK
jgi:hypothetical protein